MPRNALFWFWLINDGHMGSYRFLYPLHRTVPRQLHTGRYRGYIHAPAGWPQAPAESRWARLQGFRRRHPEQTNRTEHRKAQSADRPLAPPHQSGCGFCINGSRNHYPDFIIQMESGKVILLEAKGDDRDNSDSVAKLKLGKAWEKEAGREFRYMMVFNDNTIEGADNLTDALGKLERL